MAPKQDLRGGKASDDSFAMSRRVIVASMNRSLFAEHSRKLVKAKHNGLDRVHELCGASAPEAARGRLLCEADMIGSRMWDMETRVVVVRKVQVPIPRGLIATPQALACDGGKETSCVCRANGAHPAQECDPSSRQVGPAEPTMSKMCLSLHEKHTPRVKLCKGSTNRIVVFSDRPWNFESEGGRTPSIRRLTCAGWRFCPELRVGGWRGN